VSGHSCSMNFTLFWGDSRSSEIPVGRLSRFLTCVFGAGLFSVALLGAFEYKLLNEAQVHPPTKAFRTAG
jgi:hypothetical protein